MKLAPVGGSRFRDLPDEAKNLLRKWVADNGIDPTWVISAELVDEGHALVRSVIPDDPGEFVFVERQALIALPPPAVMAVLAQPVTEEAE